MVYLLLVHQLEEVKEYRIGLDSENVRLCTIFSPPVLCSPQNGRLRLVSKRHLYYYYIPQKLQITARFLLSYPSYII